MIATTVSHSSTDLITALRSEITMLQATIARINWNPTLRMYRASGLTAAIEALPSTTTYTVVVCDINDMHGLNNATGSWDQTDAYLATGLAVRYGEIAGQLHQKGDEYGFVLDDHTRDHTRDLADDHDTDPDGFVGRIALQLASQPIPMSATFATESGVSASDVWSAVERLSREVLSMKKERDAR